MDDMLSLTAHLPEIAFDPGATVVREGQEIGAVWVLVSGALQVSKNGVVFNSVTRPGSVVGEVSVLLGAPSGATVQATLPSVMRQAVDGAALLSSHPAITRQVALGLADRLNFVTSYLVDLKQQYGDAPGLSMVSEVLQQLANRQGPAARPGSAREPDPEY